MLLMPEQNDKKSLKTKGCALVAFHLERSEGYEVKQKERGPEPGPLLQATILFHQRGRLERS